MLAHERRLEILNLLGKNGHVMVSELAQRYHTSPETIRRDLRELEGQEKLKRTHGGASLLASETDPPLFSAFNADSPIVIESSIHSRKEEQREEKIAICRCAAQFIESGDTIYVDNSSTTLYLAQFIPRNIQITVVTNSISFVLEIVQYPSSNILILLLSGFLNRNNLSLYGSNTIKSSENIFPSKAIISCAAINAQGLITDTSMYETDIRREMIAKSNEVFLLADHSKFQKSAPYFLANCESMSTIITDTATPAENVRQLEAKGIKMIYANG